MTAEEPRRFGSSAIPRRSSILTRRSRSSWRDSWPVGVHRLTPYLEDVRTQFGDSEGHLTMVDTVLSRLAGRPAVEIDGGSDRAPDY